MKTGINRRICKELDIEVLKIIKKYESYNIKLSYSKATQILIQDYKHNNKIISIT